VVLGSRLVVLLVVLDMGLDRVYRLLLGVDSRLDLQGEDIGLLGWIDKSFFDLFFLKKKVDGFVIVACIIPYGN
jgi:hypothetical protein